MNPADSAAIMTSYAFSTNLILPDTDIASGSQEYSMYLVLYSTVLYVQYILQVEQKQKEGDLNGAEKS
jgi:hypothetical protein